MREIIIELTDEEYVVLDLWARNSKRTIEGQAAHIVVKNSKSAKLSIPTSTIMEMKYKGTGSTYEGKKKKALEWWRLKISKDLIARDKRAQATIERNARERQRRGIY